MKKAAFFDIDGTILDEHNYIPESTVQGIKKMQDQGNYAFLCTGRSRGFVQNRNLLDIGFDGIVSGCGTMIEFRDEVVFYKKIEPDMVKKTAVFLKENGAAVIMEGRYSLYADADDFAGDSFFERLRQEIGPGLLPITGSEDSYEVSKFSCTLEHADLEKLKQGLSNDYELLIHDIPVMEVVPKGHSKGTGILKVCSLLNVAVEDSYAFGDSINDLPMFEAAGHSIAMGNASEYVRQKASYVTDTLHQDGIYRALEHFGLLETA